MSKEVQEAHARLMEAQRNLAEALDKELLSPERRQELQLELQHALEHWIAVSRQHVGRTAQGHRGIGS